MCYDQFLFTFSKSIHTTNKLAKSLSNIHPASFLQHSLGHSPNTLKYYRHINMLSCVFKLLVLILMVALTQTKPYPVPQHDYDHKKGYDCVFKGGSIDCDREKDYDYVVGGESTEDATSISKTGNVEGKSCSGIVECNGRRRRSAGEPGYLMDVLGYRDTRLVN